MRVCALRFYEFFAVGNPTEVELSAPVLIFIRELSKPGEVKLIS